MQIKTKYILAMAYIRLIAREKGALNIRYQVYCLNEERNALENSQSIQYLRNHNFSLFMRAQE